MSAGYLDAHVQCPFFRRIDLHTGRICCEGLTDESSIILHYNRREDLSIQFDFLCCNKYKNCEVFRAIMEAKYQE